MSGSGTRAPSGAVPPAQSVQQRLQAVMQHQQFWWWVGHVLIVLATLASAAYWFRGAYASRMALFWYRLALLGAIGSYGVVVHKMFFRVGPARVACADGQNGLRDAQKQEGLFYRLYLDENAEYFGEPPPPPPY